MARPRGPCRAETPSASCGLVNEVSAGGRAKPPGSGDDGSSNPSEAESCSHPAAATSFTDPGAEKGVRNLFCGQDTFCRYRTWAGVGRARWRSCL